MTAKRERFSVSIERLKAFSDGVVAIAITILVLGIAMPTLSSNVSNTEFLNQFHKLLPSIYAYCLSFLIIGKSWQIHNLILTRVEKTDDRLIWLNLFFLLFLSFIPFPTDLLGKYNNMASIILFDASVFLPMLMLSLIALYVLKKNFISLPESIKDKEAQARMFLGRTMIKVLAIPVIAVISIVTAFFNREAALFAWLLYPAVKFIFYFIRF